METGFYKTYFEVEKHHWLMRVRRAIVRDQLARHLPVLGATARILDFGSGAGALAGELQRAGVEAHGVDASKEAIDYGTAHGVRNLLTHKEGKLPYADAYFDCVLAMDVLEHLPEEAPVLTEIKRVLKKNGVLIITVPAYMFLWGRQDEVSQHFRRYTLGRLIEVMRASGGFEIMKRSYFNTFLFPLVALVRVGSWVLNHRGKGSDFEMNNRLLNALFFGIFDLERRLLKHLNYPFGVSILLVVKKIT